MVNDVFQMKEGNPVFRGCVAQQLEQFGISAEGLALGQVRQCRFSEIEPLGNGAAFGFFANFSVILFDLSLELFEALG